MKLSVILPCFNDEDYLGCQLEALAGQHWSEPWEVVVADNGSTDRSRAIAESYRGRLPNLRLVNAADRRGPAHARNVAVRTATGESLAFCDADDEVAPGWVAAMGRALAQHEFVACRLEVEKLNPPWLTRWAPQAHGLQRFPRPPYLLHAGAGTLGVRRGVHEAVGGFDESMPYCSDTDYCFRVQLANTELHFVPDALIHLRYRDSLIGQFRQRRNWARYNVLLYKKYRLPDMPPVSWKDGLHAWVTLLRRAPHVRDKAALALWVWQLAMLIGRLEGSIEYRVLAL